MRGTYKEMTYEQLEPYWKRKEFVFVDIRSKYEYEKGHLPGTLSYPEHELMMDYARLDPCKVYVFICQRGKNSKDLAISLSKYGYKTINMAGGLEAIEGNG